MKYTINAKVVLPGPPEGLWGGGSEDDLRRRDRLRFLTKLLQFFRGQKSFADDTGQQ